MPTAARLRWGILGVATINDMLVPAFAAARNAELVAIASRTPGRARAAADTAKVAKAYDSYEALLDDPEIDAVYNPLPNHLHAEWTMKAAERGKHVLCEKPMALTAAEAQHMVDFCRDKGVTLLDGFMWPHHPRTTMMRQILDSGRIGAVRQVIGSFTFLLPENLHNIRFKPEMGGGSLLDVGCYPVYGIRWAMQAEPTHVFAHAEFQHGVDVAVNGVLWFADGRRAAFDCGFTLPTRQELEVVGTTGVLRVRDLWQPATRAAFQVTPNEGTPEELAVEGENHVVHLIENLCASILDKTPLRPPVTEAVKTLRVLDALARSAREGTVVAVESV